MQFKFLSVRLLTKAFIIVVPTNDKKVQNSSNVAASLKIGENRGLGLCFWKKRGNAIFKLI